MAAVNDSPKTIYATISNVISTIISRVSRETSAVEKVALFQDEAPTDYSTQKEARSQYDQNKANAAIKNYQHRIY